MAINLDGNGVNTTGLINSATAQTTTSGTSIDFTGIPSGVKRITVMVANVSGSGTAALLVRLGTSGGVVSSGYTTAWAYQYLQSNNGAASETTGFTLVNGGTAAQNASGSVVFTNLTGNTWTGTGMTARTADVAQIINCAGYITLGGTLDRIRVTTSNGTDTFDAGSINILYE